MVAEAFMSTQSSEDAAVELGESSTDVSSENLSLLSSEEVRSVSESPSRSSSGGSSLRSGISVEPYVIERERQKAVARGQGSIEALSFVGVDGTHPFMNIDARITEVGEDFVRLDCLVDSANRLFEEREFERELLKGLPLHVGAYVFIRVLQRPRKMMFTFHDGEKYVRHKDLFEDDTWIDELDTAGLDQMLD